MSKTTPVIYAPYDVKSTINRLHETFGIKKAEILREAVRLIDWILWNFPTRELTLKRIVDDVINVLKKEAERRHKITLGEFRLKAKSGE